MLRCQGSLQCAAARETTGRRTKKAWALTEFHLPSQKPHILWCPLQTLSSSQGISCQHTMKRHCLGDCPAFARPAHVLDASNVLAVHDFFESVACIRFQSSHLDYASSAGIACMPCKPI